MSQEQQIGTNKASQEDLPSYPFPFADHSLDVPTEYDRLRQQCPVARVHMPYGGDALVPTRYEEIAQGFANPKCDAIRTSMEMFPAWKQVTSPELRGQRQVRFLPSPMHAIISCAA
jgi:hypothetical protein